MRKKIIKFSFITIALISFLNIPVYAYEFESSENKNKVNDMIAEIFDAKEQYEEMAGVQKEEIIEVYEATNDSYWWPIGSVETTSNGNKEYATGNPETTSVTSQYGYRIDPVTQARTQFHSGLDIAGGRGLGQVNIIAAKSGIVVYPTNNDSTNCPTSSGNSNCGGGYGNYVIIQHTDGNYTLYAHMHANTITVKAGDSVEQGQIIGKMGSSGYSTGPHLHFEIREGQNSSSSAVDPLTYISAEKSRIANASDQFIEWLEIMEGCTDEVGDGYLVVDIGDGVRTVGSGVTLEYNVDRFAKYGIDINDYPIGSTIKQSIVDEIKVQIVNDRRESIEKTMSENSITLKPHQIDALVSQSYNIGNIVGFVDAYKKYGNTIDLYNNWMFRATMPGSEFEAGLTRRRKCEWAMFHEGVYKQDV